METELKELLRLLLRRSWFIALMAVAFVGAVFFYQEKYAVPEYEAVAKVIVHASSSAEYTDTYEEIMMTPAILAPTAARYSELGLTAEELGARLTVGASENSQVISIAVRDPSPDQAAAIVRAVARTFQEEIPAIMKVDSVTILSNNLQGDLPRNVSKSLSSLLVIGFVLSVIVSVGLILLREYFDDKLRTEKDIAQALGKPMLGTFTRIRKRDFKHSGTMKTEEIAGTGKEASKKIKSGESINVSVNQQA